MTTDVGIIEGVALRLAKSSLPSIVTWVRVKFVAISSGVRESLPAQVATTCRVIPVGVDFERFNRSVEIGCVRAEFVWATRGL